MMTALEPVLCRSIQEAQLSTLLDVIVCHGPAATGKTLVVERVLSGFAEVPHAVVRSQECITGRHLFESIAGAVRSSLAEDDWGPRTLGPDQRCESLATLSAQLQTVLESCSRFYLVADGVDRQREAPPTLLPALARLGEIIPSLTVIFLVHHASPSMLRLAGAPHIAFSAYTRAESLEIAGAYPLPLSQTSTHEDAADTDWLWPRFCAMVWDALGRGAARDVPSFRTLCTKLWPTFVAPVLSGEVKARELAKLATRARALLQGEDKVVERLVKVEALPLRKAPSHSGLSYYAKFVLISAYLASHNPARLDSVFFMKMHDKKRRRRNRASAQATATGAAVKHYKIQRRLLGPQGFGAERLLAIFAAILPHDPPPGGAGADVLAQIAGLTALRLLVRAGGAADPGDGGARWRVNVGLEFVRSVARAVRFEIDEFLEE